MCLCESIESRGTGAIGSYDLPCGWWDLNLGSLDEQTVLRPSATSSTGQMQLSSLTGSFLFIASQLFSSTFA